jgi:predicted dienelactone hydrolase
MAVWSLMFGAASGWRSLGAAGSRVLLAGCGWLMMAGGAIAADRVFVSYNLFERSIPVASLEAYARTGKIDRPLAIYAQYAKPKELEQLRTILLVRADLSAVAVSQFLYSPQGEVLLKRLGQVIQPESRISGFKAIRAALILATADDANGLTLLNVLRKFPTRGLRIDVEKSLQIASTLQRAINQTQRAATAVTQQAILEQQSLINAPQGLQADLRQRGGFAIDKQTLSLIDRRRPAVVTVGNLATDPAGRSLVVDVYTPQSSQSPGRDRYPVIVISHGLGSDRTSLAYLAEHLASYGFGVFVLEHPGSNKKQLQALIRGTTQAVADPVEFIDRPLDVSFVLDRFQGDATFNRLNFQRVGVIGQSFGGYTALVLAGGTINPQQLKLDCQTLENTLNLSQLLQCQAEKLTGKVPPLADPRVQAVIALNPISSTVLGQSGISKIAVPTMVVAGIADTVAPALPEQITPFTGLATVTKYLVTLDRGTHFSFLNDAQNADNPFDIPDEVVGPNPALARRYISALSVAFFQTYVANQPSFEAYLSAAYAKAITEPAIRLNLVRSFTEAQLAQAIAGKSGSRPIPQTPSAPTSPSGTP